MENAKEMDMLQVFTCGVCEEICENLDAVAAHLCLKGFGQIRVDENNYFYPVCADRKIVRRSDLHGVEAIVTENTQLPLTIRQSQEHVQSSQSTDGIVNAEEILIAEVHLRELLWNQKISIAKRDRGTIEKLWDEVSQATNGKYSPNEARKKWKNLRDRFMRIIASEKLSSGAASSGSKNQWRFYESLQFLRDTLLRKETATNMDNMSVCSDDNDEEVCIEKQDLPNKNAEKTSRKRTHKSSNHDNILEEINEALRQPMATLELPQAPVADEIDSYSIMMAEQLRTLPKNRRRHIMFKMYEMLHKELLQSEES